MITVFVVIIVAAVLMWAVAQLPLDPAIVNILRVLVVVLLVLYVLQAFGLIGGPALHLR